MHTVDPIHDNTLRTKYKGQHLLAMAEYDHDIIIVQYYCPPFVHSHIIMYTHINI